MEENKKVQLLEKAKELANSEDVSKAYYEIKALGRNFRDNDDTSLYDAELNRKYEDILASVTAKMGDIKGDIKQKKEEIIASAKQVLNSNNFKSNKMKELMDAWKNLGHLDKEADDALWNEFNEVRQAYYDKKQKYYDELKAKFEANRVAKTALVEKTKEALKSDDIPATNKVMNELMEEWKKVGNAGKEFDDALWKEFSSLRKEFFKKRDSYYEQMKSVYEEHANKKQELIAKAKLNLARSEFTDAEVNEMKALRDEWKKIGSAGRDLENDLWEKFSGIMKKYNDNMKYYR